MVLEHKGMLYSSFSTLTIKFDEKSINLFWSFFDELARIKHFRLAGRISRGDNNFLYQPI